MTLKTLVFQGKSSQKLVILCLRKKEHQNSGTLGKDTINNWIIPFLSVGKRGFKSNFDLASIFLFDSQEVKNRGTMERTSN